MEPTTQKPGWLDEVRESEAELDRRIRKQLRQERKARKEAK